MAELSLLDDRVYHRQKWTNQRATEYRAAFNYSTHIEVSRGAKYVQSAMAELSLLDDRVYHQQKWTNQRATKYRTAFN